MPPAPPAPGSRAARRAARARGRWWVPGAVVAVGAAVVGWLATLAWQAFEATGCGNGDAMFACLVESLVATALAVVLGPVLLWLSYRAAGVRRPLLSVPVAAAVAFVLLAAPELLSEVRLLAGVDRPLEPLLGPGVGTVLGLAALAGGLALQGPHRVVRAVVAAVALAGLVGAVLVLQDVAEQARLRGVLTRAQVPLLLPEGWQPYSPYVDDESDLSYSAVPPGWPGYGFEGVDVDVRRGPDALAAVGDSCSYRACATLGGITYELPEDGSGTTAWRVVDGTVVSASTYGERPDLPALDPVDTLREVSVVTPDEWLARTFDER